MQRLKIGPRSSEFFGLLARAGENAHEAALKAEARFREFPGSAVSQEEIEALEHEGDHILHDLVRFLNEQFVTAFDREDVFELAGAVDDVVDHVEEATGMLGLYGIEAPTRQSLALCGVLVAAAAALAEALGSLRSLGKVEPLLLEVKRHEDEGDRISRDAIADLFRDRRIDPLIVIRWKDIYEELEEAIDACDRAATLIGNIVVKNR